MPVAHSYEATRIHAVICKFSLERPRLPLSEAADRRASANGCVMMLHFARACGRNKFGQRFSPDAGERKVNNIGIAEKVIKERLYRSQRIRTAQLKQNYPHTARCLRHPFRFLGTREFTPIRGEIQWWTSPTAKRRAAGSRGPAWGTAALR